MVIDFLKGCAIGVVAFGYLKFHDWFESRWRYWFERRRST